MIEETVTAAAPAPSAADTTAPDAVATGEKTRQRCAMMRMMMVPVFWSSVTTAVDVLNERFVMIFMCIVCLSPLRMEALCFSPRVGKFMDRTYALSPLSLWN